MIDVLIISLSILFIASLTINIFLYKAVNIQLKKVDIYENWVSRYKNDIDEFRAELRTTYLKMKTIDDKELFSKDDDVGVIFQELLSLLEQLNTKVQL